jgi:uncharacterized membrane protein YpjA
MMNFWYFVPKSGVAFIFITVALIIIWNRYKALIPHPYVWIFAAELILFLICFYIADHESSGKRKKPQ